MTNDISTSLTSALSGLQVGVNRARTAAGDVAKLTTGSENVQDAIRPLLSLQQSEQEISAASKIVKAEDGLGRFVDETA